MDNYINLAELRKTAEALLLKINQVADAGIGEDDITLKPFPFSYANPSTDTDENGNLILGTIKNQNILFPTGILDSGNSVGDVRINGSSILNGSVANIPKASSTVLGVVRVSSTYGTNVESNGTVRIEAATSAQIKSGTETYRPIVPLRQSESVFYGLAKIAGDTSQSLSSNIVGTYTDQAKFAIQIMLGINSMLAPVETDATANQTYSIGDMFSYNGKLYKATAIIASGATITPNTNCVETTISNEIITRSAIMPAAGVSF